MIVSALKLLLSVPVYLGALLAYVVGLMAVIRSMAGDSPARTDYSTFPIVSLSNEAIGILSLILGGGIGFFVFAGWFASAWFSLFFSM